MWAKRGDARSARIQIFRSKICCFTYSTATLVDRQVGNEKAGSLSHNAFAPSKNLERISRTLGILEEPPTYGEECVSTRMLHTLLINRTRHALRNHKFINASDDEP